MSIQNSHHIGDVKVMLKVGADGSGIESIEKTGTSGIVDTYTITMTDGSKSTFTVTNGSSIESIEKTSTVGLVDTYTITLTNGDTSTFEVHNASGGGMLAHILITSDAGSTVTVTTPSGDVITATQVTGSTTQWECDTQEYGVHYIDSVLGGEDEQVTLTVDTCKVYSIDDSHIHASITVTFPQGFTCRCQGNGENYYANSNPYTFSVHSLGTFTITATDGTTTYTEAVTITSSSQSVTMYCPSVANAPTDDVQLWLMYGDITDKNYTTLAEVLADTTTYSALIADHDAVDYMVRSTTWASGVCADSTAMTYIGLNNYCANTLLADSDWLNAICNSAYFESVLNVKVPTMTDDTHPSGVAGCSSYVSNHDAYKAFDGNDGTYWNCLKNGATGQWAGYKFNRSVCIKMMIIIPYSSTVTPYVKNFDLIGSDDDFTTLETLLSEVCNVAPSNKFVMNNNVLLDGYRVVCTSASYNTGNAYDFAINTIQLYGRVDV